MALLEGIASYLDGLGLVDWRPATSGGDCFLEHVPQAPVECVALYLYGGDEADTKLG